MAAEIRAVCMLLAAGAVACGASPQDPHAESPAGTTSGGNNPPAMTTPPPPSGTAGAPDSGAPDAAVPDAAGDAGPKPLALPSFFVGYNEAWWGMNYGSDLTTGFDMTVVEKTLDAIVQAGGDIVRVWLFELQQGWSMKPTSPQIQSLDPVLLTNLGKVLDAAKARGVFVYLTALDGNEMPQDAGPKRDLFWNLLNDQYGEGSAYQNNVLAPLLAVLDQHQDIVFGFDLMNEIQAPRLHSFWADPVGGPRGFMQRTRAFVKSKSPWLKVTTSGGWDTAQYDIASGFYSGIGLDFYDLHVYSDTGTYLGLQNVCSRAAQDGVPVILGEFGQNSHVVDDNLQANVTRKFLTDAKASCFKGALAWRFDAAENWWNYQRSDSTFRPAVSVIQQF